MHHLDIKPCNILLNYIDRPDYNLIKENIEVNYCDVYNTLKDTVNALIDL